jgi:hypothetical protein
MLAVAIFTVHPDGGTDKHHRHFGGGSDGAGLLQCGLVVVFVVRCADGIVNLHATARQCADFIQRAVQLPGLGGGAAEPCITGCRAGLPMTAKRRSCWPSSGSRSWSFFSNTRDSAAICRAS